MNPRPDEGAPRTWDALVPRRELRAALAEAVAKAERLAHLRVSRDDFLVCP